MKLGPLMTIEAGRKISKALTGRKQSTDHVRKRSESMKGQPRTERAKRNISNGLKGRKLSEEHIKNMSKALKGRKLSKEHIKALTGHKHSEETKKKISMALKGRKFSKEHRRNLSKAASIAFVDGRGPFCSKHFIKGQYYSEKNKQLLNYRSNYELHAYQLLEKMYMVVKYEVEPFSIKYRRGFDDIREYIPDILITYKDRSKELVEVKPECRLDDDIVQKKFRATIQWCRANNVSFSFWTEDQVFKEKIREPVRI